MSRSVVQTDDRVSRHADVAVLCRNRAKAEIFFAGGPCVIWGPTLILKRFAPYQQLASVQKP